MQTTLLSAGSRTAFERPNARCHCLEVRTEIAKDEGVLLAELIVRFVVNAVTGSCLSERSQALRQLYDLLDKQHTNSDIGSEAGIGEARKLNFTIFC